MAFKTALSLFLVFACVIAYTAATRDLTPGRDYSDLSVRLQASGGLTHCWNALMELKSCTNEIVVFFVNGKSNIGLDCCQAIEVLTKNCWPVMLTSLGFTAEEGSILRGYCDASEPLPSVPAPSPLSG